MTIPLGELGMCESSDVDKAVIMTITVAVFAAPPTPNVLHEANGCSQESCVSRLDTPMRVIKGTSFHRLCSSVELQVSLTSTPRALNPAGIQLKDGGALGAASISRRRPLHDTCPHAGHTRARFIGLH